MNKKLAVTVPLGSAAENGAQTSEAVAARDAWAQKIRGAHGGLKLEIVG